LCPPPDRRGSLKDVESVNYLTNVIPQAPVRNRTLWNDFEIYNRQIVEEGNQLFIIAGTGGSENSIANGKITVPSVVWKVALIIPEEAKVKQIDQTTRVIAIRMSNKQKASINDWRDCRTSVRNLEDELEYDFFSSLDNKVSAILKSKIDGD
jgi:endonuclease G